METPLARGRIWIRDSQPLLRRGAALLVRQWSPAVAVRDAPDIASALAGLGRGPAIVLVDILQAGEGDFARLPPGFAQAPPGLGVLPPTAGASRGRSQGGATRAPPLMAQNGS